MPSTNPALIKLTELKLIPLRRTLGVSYSIDGTRTSVDPGSYDKPHEIRTRIAHQVALLKEHPTTGYASGIRKEMATRGRFFQPYSSVAEFKNGLLAPVLWPSLLGFMSAQIFLESLSHLAKMFAYGSVGLAMKLGNERDSAYYVQTAIAFFNQARACAQVSAILAFTSILTLLDSSLKLVVRSASTLINAITETVDGEEDPELNIPSPSAMFPMPR